MDKYRCRDMRIPPESRGHSPGTRPWRSVAEQATFEVLTKSGLDVKWSVAGGFTILPAGGQVGLQILANSLVQEGCGRPARAVDSWAGGLRMDR